MKKEDKRLPRGKITERILRVLLNEPEGTLSKYELAKKANASRSWVHEFLENIESENYVVDTKVKNYDALITYWIKLRKKPIKKKNFQVRDALDLLKNVNLDYALTTYQAENLVNNYLFPSRIDVYIHEKDLNIWKNRLIERGLLGGGNFRLLMDVDHHIFYKSFKKENLRIVSIPQLIVDLYELGQIEFRSKYHRFPSKSELEEYIDELTKNLRGKQNKI